MTGRDAAAWWGEYLVGRHLPPADRHVDEFAEFQQPMDRSLTFTVKHTFCPRGALAMWVADMDLPVDPAIHAAILERARHPCFGYTLQPPELWAAAAAWMREEHGWLSVEPEHFVFAPNLVSATVALLFHYLSGEAYLGALPRWLANGLPPVPEWEEEEEHSVLHGQSGKRSTSTSARAVELEPLDVDLEAARATQVQP